MSKLQALAETVRRQVHLVDVEHLLARLAELAKKQRARGHVTRAGGVHSAIDLIRRDLARQAKAATRKAQ